MDYLELRFSEIMQNKVGKQIHFELSPTSASRDEIGKLSGQYVSNQQGNRIKFT